MPRLRQPCCGFFWGHFRGKWDPSFPTSGHTATVCLSYFTWLLVHVKRFFSIGPRSTNLLWHFDLFIQALGLLWQHPFGSIIRRALYLPFTGTNIFANKMRWINLSSINALNLLFLVSFLCKVPSRACLPTYSLPLSLSLSLFLSYFLSFFLSVCLFSDSFPSLSLFTDSFNRFLSLTRTLLFS